MLKGITGSIRRWGREATTPDTASLARAHSTPETRIINPSKTLIVLAAVTSVLAEIVAAPLASGADSTAPPTEKYRFELTQGAHTPVCQAFLRRLNTATYTTPPYCDSPEHTAVPGFTPLHRVPLTAAEAVMMSTRVTDFMRTQRQHTKEEYEAKEAALRARLRHFTKAPPQEVAIRDEEKLLQSGALTAWRYDPPVDIDNDGKPDDVLVWQGTGLDGVWGAICGHPIGTTGFETDGRVPQVAFILAHSNDPLDVPINVEKTKEIFGSPSSGYLHPGESVPDQRFRPLGPTIGIFKYRDLYYLDTFVYNHPVASWGFLTEKREYNPKLANTLAVFLRQNGKTQRVCEYRMTETH